MADFLHGLSSRHPWAVVLVLASAAIGMIGVPIVGVLGVGTAVAAAAVRDTVEGS